jgi:hypothetical protein
MFQAGNVSELRLRPLFEFEILLLMSVFDFAMTYSSYTALATPSE